MYINYLTEKSVQTVTVSHYTVVLSAYLMHNWFEIDSQQPVGFFVINNIFDTDKTINKMC